ncbi:outer surface protein [Bacillus cereus group sp. N21]|uniref:outer surface protein n=1 Tax=Bacillus cereus group sp. N21 TaxID=2794591 RepID=UPI0018F54A3A|nr:outer surface protein [Bacillus cereus group sp. N21]MBJ8030752.1 outer surface protein [Bacillus cereus group sp. N21]
MKITWKKVICVVVILLMCLPFTLGKESKVKDFPVSVFSSYIAGDDSKGYRYISFLPDAAIWINGSEKKWSEGERTVYQKGGRIVNVFHPPGEDVFYLYDSQDMELGYEK